MGSGGGLRDLDAVYANTKGILTRLNGDSMWQTSRFKSFSILMLIIFSKATNSVSNHDSTRPNWRSGVGDLSPPENEPLWEAASCRQQASSGGAKATENMRVVWLKIGHGGMARRALAHVVHAK